jgi:carboxypeptidase D
MMFNSKVPFDLPLVAHDMLLRFMGVNILTASGPAAAIPSKVGEETETVVSETHPNGTAIGSESLEPISDDSNSKTKEDFLERTYSNIGNITFLLIILGILGGLTWCWKKRFFRIGRYSKKVNMSMKDRMGMEPIPTDDPQELEMLEGGYHDKDRSSNGVQQSQVANGSKNEGNDRLLGNLGNESEIFSLGDEEEDKE